MDLAHWVGSLRAGCKAKEKIVRDNMMFRRLPFSKSIVAGILSVSLFGCSRAALTTAETTTETGFYESETSETEDLLGGEVGDFTLKDVDGLSVSLSDYLGKNVIVISYWSTACGPCKKEMVQLHELFLKYKNQGLMVLSIATDEPETQGEVRPYIKQRGYTFPVLLDTESLVKQQFNPKGGQPFTLIISRDQKIVWTHDGYVPGDEKFLEDEIRKALDNSVD